MDKIKVDTKILLEIEGKTDIEGRQNIYSFSSRVEEIERDGFLVVQMPIYKGGYFMLPRDRLILVYSFIGERMFSLTARYEGRVVRGELVYARLRPTSALRPSQRRNCYRLQCSLPIEILQIDPYLERKIRGYGQMVNISDGGMLFVANNEAKPDEVISITFDLGDKKNKNIMATEGKVIRAERLYGTMYQYRVAVRFVNMPRAERDKIYKYILEKQREKMRA